MTLLLSLELSVDFDIIDFGVLLDYFCGLGAEGSFYNGFTPTGIDDLREQNWGVYTLATQLWVTTRHCFVPNVIKHLYEAIKNSHQEVFGVFGILTPGSISPLNLRQKRLCGS